MYFSLGLIVNVFNQSTIQNRYQYNISEIGYNNDFNEFFNTFLSSYFNIYLDTLQMSLQYVAKFYVMDFDCSFPAKSVLNVPQMQPVTIIFT